MNIFQIANKTAPQNIISGDNALIDPIIVPIQELNAPLTWFIKANSQQPTGKITDEQPKTSL